MKFRHVFHRCGVILAAMGLLLSSARASAAWPEHPIRLLVGFSAGGGADGLARVLAQSLTQTLGQSVVVENKPGAGTTLAAADLAKSPADGYTLMMLTSTNTISPAMYKKLSYDPAKDFTMIGMVARGPMLIAASKSSGITTLAQLIEKAKQNPGKLNYGAGGIGTTPHLAGLVLQQMAGIKMTHIPYKGGSDTAVALVSGQLDVQFGTPPSVNPIASRSNLLAVTTAQRSKLAPGIPAASETVKGYEVVSWYGLGAPAGVPKSVIDKLSAALHTALTDPHLDSQLTALGVEAAVSTPEEADRFYEQELHRWHDLVQAEGLQASD